MKNGHTSVGRFTAGLDIGAKEPQVSANPQLRYGQRETTNHVAVSAVHVIPTWVGCESAMPRMPSSGAATLSMEFVTVLQHCSVFPGGHLLTTANNCE
jgi:hypothetical protein